MPWGDLNRERKAREAYTAHSTELYGLAIRTLADPKLAEEAVEQTFLLASREDHLDPEPGSLRSSLFAALRGILVNLGATPEHLEHSLRAWQVEEAMRRLSEQHRQILVETVYRGRSYTEVEAELGVPQATVKSHVNDGLQALKVALSEVAIEGSEPRD
ncbi:MAG TPA: sigma factor-like helix-turn-helix DNA-binding protein [Solirubrobacterales bacterium]|nr:sigma factor-like helix-turn-helix DNA-binding protein [Solirubrobacterales bacterium]